MSLRAIESLRRTPAPNSAEKRRQRAAAGLAGAFLAAILAGCGGGGGGGGGGGAPAAGFPASAPVKVAEPAKSPEPAPEPPAAPCRIVLYGDSIMRGEPLIPEGPARRMAKLRPAWDIDQRAV